MSAQRKWADGYELLAERAKAATAERVAQTKVERKLAVLLTEYAGISPRHVLLMLAIGEPFEDDAVVADEELPHQGNIALKSGYEQSHLSKTLLRELGAKYGLVEPFYAEERGRQKFYRLTPAGIDALDRLFPP